MAATSAMARKAGLVCSARVELAYTTMYLWAPIFVPELTARVKSSEAAPIRFDLELPV
jgi:hypothetical protein